MTAGLVRVNGTRIFVDDRGPQDAAALVYVHGGPGLGCHDFMTVQGDQLARSMRVIGVDQRGVLRSDDLPASPAISVDVLVHDLEALRELLGIDSWYVLGHSAGGCYALVYATSHPSTVDGVVFDCPCWDADLTDRYRLPHAAALLAERGRHEAAARCLALADKPSRIVATDRSWEAMLALGDEYSSLFFASNESAKGAEEVMARGGFSEEQLSRGRSHEALMSAMYENHLGLVDALTQRSLLCRGRQDLVTPPSVVEAFRARARAGRVHTFEHSAHFPYLEQPEEYAEVIGSFVADAGHL